MIYSVSGILTHVEPGFAVIECGGVGFKCLTTSNTIGKLPKTGEKTRLYTYLNVREDALDLFGFADDRELQCFKMLITVSGVGPKAALSVLSEMTPEKFALYVASSDSKALQRAQGIGVKTAQRIVLELKDKVSGEQAALGFKQEELPVSASGNIEEAISALMVLGYSRSEAASAAAKSDSSLSVEEIIKQSLRLLAK
ncbi:MAG TPA: Holliday junction branch migration protein RuvA [Ruminiclostridium sp.]|nr:Holliday junction branch migration protein RuvA [Ruminiclostridium sp.]